MVALVGDAELDEGNIYECAAGRLEERPAQHLVDHRLQPAVARRVVHEGLFEAIEKIFEAFGWDVVRVKYGALQRAAFEEPGGEAARLDRQSCPNQLYSALTFMGGAVWRKRLMDDLGDQGDVSALIDGAATSELAALMENLGGNCVETMAEAFDSDRPRPADLFPRLHDQGLGHADRRPQGQSRRADEQGPDGRVAAAHGRAEGEEWEPFATVEGQGRLQAFLDRCRSSPRAGAAFRCACDARAQIFPDDREISTQMAFGKILDDLAKGDSELAERIVTTSPDVTGTTNLGPWVNRRKLFARRAGRHVQRSTFPPPRNGSSHPDGQHIELGIAEMNLFLLLGAAGLSHSPVRQAADPDRHGL
jgi:pyruvate dehydrogenase E1 component